jgi:hypothetical protein
MNDIGIDGAGEGIGDGVETLDDVALAERENRHRDGLLN